MTADKPRIPRRQKADLPTRAFLYTLDQLETMFGMTESELRGYLFYEGQDFGRRDDRMMVARNIARPGQPANWRVAEEEVIRWGQRIGFAFYSRRFLG